jgi:predicted DNA-binding ribbon-helix-helix protein
MNEDWLDEEIRMREKARAHAGEVVEGAGSRGAPRRMTHMVSTRLDGSLIRRLRAIAQERGVTVSDLLRESAEQVVNKSYTAAQPRISYTITGTDTDGAIQTTVHTLPINLLAMPDRLG